MLLKLSVIIILVVEMIILRNKYFTELFVVLNNFIIEYIIMKGEDNVKKLMKTKKASSIIFYMEMFN